MSAIRQGNVVPLSPKTLLDRIEIDGVVANIAAVTHVKTRIWQYATFEDAESDTDGTEMGTEITTLSAACMFNTLQTAMWNNKDSLGYNCKIVIPSARFPAGGKYYGIDNLVQPSAVGAESFLLDRWVLYALPTGLD